MLCTYQGRRVACGALPAGWECGEMDRLFRFLIISGAAFLLSKPQMTHTTERHLAITKSAFSKPCCLGWKYFCTRQQKISKTSLNIKEDSIRLYLRLWSSAVIQNPNKGDLREEGLIWAHSSGGRVHPGKEGVNASREAFLAGLAGPIAFTFRKQRVNAKWDWTTFPREAPPPKDSTAFPNSGHQVLKHVNLWGTMHTQATTGHAQFKTSSCLKCSFCVESVKHLVQCQGEPGVHKQTFRPNCGISFCYLLLCNSH